MTPAERARLIDQQEFEAECRAVRHRVYSRLGIKQAEDRARVQRTMAIPVQPAFVKRPVAARQAVLEEQPAEPKPKYVRRHGPIAPVHSIAGRSLTRRQWAAELGITYNAMHQAVHRLGSIEAVAPSSSCPAMIVASAAHRRPLSGTLSAFAGFPN